MRTTTTLLVATLAFGALLVAPPAAAEPIQSQDADHEKDLKICHPGVRYDRTDLLTPACIEIYD